MAGHPASSSGAPGPELSSLLAMSRSEVADSQPSDARPTPFAPRTRRSPASRGRPSNSAILRSCPSGHPSAGAEDREGVVALDASERRLDDHRAAGWHLGAELVGRLACALLVGRSDEQVLAAPHGLRSVALELAREPLRLAV